MTATKAVGIELTKKPHIKESWTLNHIQEVEKCANDPIYFIENYIYVQGRYGRELLKLYDFQVEMVRSFHDNRRSICLLARQMGKTTAAAGYILWFALFNADKNVLIAANKNKQALEIMGRIRFAYEELPNFIRAGVTEYNKMSLAFDNGSRIISTATTADAGRGLTIHFLYLDEFAFVPRRMAEDFWTAIQPTLAATHGRCVVTSTPNSNEDTFAIIWKGANDILDANGFERPNQLGANGFKAIKAIWSRHPDRDDDWAAQERAAMGDERFLREYECEFIIDDETLINQMIVSTMEGINPAYTTGQVRWYSKPEPNKTYIAGLDPSMGTGGDYSAITVWQLPEMKQVAEWKDNKTPIKGQVSTLLSILKLLREAMINNYEQAGEPDIYWSVENNTLGEAALVVIENTGEENFPGTFVSEPNSSRGVRVRRKGLTTSNKSKLTACARLKSMVENSKMTINSKALVKELKTFVSKGTTYEAKSRGDHDDLVCSTLLCIRILDIIKNWDEALAERLNEGIELDSEDSAPMPMAVLSTY